MNRLAISFSGGKTSAYMTHRLLNDEGARDRYDQVEVVFANTGQEHEKTLEFVDRCDRELGFDLTWVEAVVHHGERRGATHKIVDFETASRAGDPFEEVIKKYGIPGPAFKPPACTRELKGNPIRSYLRSVGFAPRTYHHAIGIRADEMDRIDPAHEEKGFIYPLIDWGVDKQWVNTFWVRQPFTLEIPEHLGNCTWCWKKSLRKHLTLARENPEVFEFPRRMEQKYEDFLPGSGEGGPRRFFRNRMTVDDIMEMLDQPFERFMEGDSHRQMSMIPDLDATLGCSDSCEPFGTDEDTGDD